VASRREWRASMFAALNTRNYPCSCKMLATFRRTDQKGLCPSAASGLCKLLHFSPEVLPQWLIHVAQALLCSVS
jgi:hypothetical protein